MNRIGIMGGTFNPIHIGHLMLADCAREELALDEVWFIPTGFSYHKGGSLGPVTPTPRERLHMTELAIGNVPYFHCLDIEVTRKGNTYSYETLEKLRTDFPDKVFFFILGADCLDTIETWKCPEKIFQNCHVAAAVRGNAGNAGIEGTGIEGMEERIKYLRRTYGAQIDLLPFRRLQISSTEIRERVRQGRSVRYMLPDNVLSYIKEKGFYRDENN